MDENEKIEFAKKQIAKAKEERERAAKEYWNNLPTLDTVDKVPPLPTRVPPDTWKNFYVRKLVEAGAIPKCDLIDGEFYLGDHRRATVAKWNADLQEFEYWRCKFGQRYIDQCNHFEDDDGYALFVPIRLANKDQFERNAE
jgi:hypothetical protein